MQEMTHMWTVIRSLFTDQSYGHTLEQYILSRNPQDSHDIERLEREYNMMQSRRTSWHY